jgi:hypothetical protein
LGPNWPTQHPTGPIRGPQMGDLARISPCTLRLSRRLCPLPLNKRGPRWSLSQKGLLSTPLVGPQGCPGPWVPSANPGTRAGPIRRGSIWPISRSAHKDLSGRLRLPPLNSAVLDDRQPERTCPRTAPAGGSINPVRGLGSHLAIPRMADLGDHGARWARWARSSLQGPHVSAFDPAQGAA